MFEIISQCLDSGLVVVADKAFGLAFSFVESNFTSVRVEDDYFLVFTKIDGTTKKVDIL